MSHGMRASFATIWLFSLLSMTLIDYRLGAKAQIINAWSVVERLLGRQTSAGDSQIYTQGGAWVEALLVLAVSGAAAWIIFAALRSVLR